MKKVRVWVKRRQPISQPSEPEMTSRGKSASSFPAVQIAWEINSAEEDALAEEAYRAYFAMFPGDDEVMLKDPCEADAIIDGMFDKKGWSLYLWGVENHRHWWEKEDLSDDVVREPRHPSHFMV